MEVSKDNIELRSDKVRSIIGQIPPWVIRSGTTVILLIIMLLLVGSYFFKYPYTVTVSVVLSKVGSACVGTIELPVDEIAKVKEGQLVEIVFDDIQGARRLTFTSHLAKIQKKVFIANKKSFYQVQTDTIDNLVIDARTLGTAKITTQKISLFERILKPFGTLHTK